MKKIKFYIEDRDYKNGLKTYLTYYPEIRSSVEILESLDQFKEDSNMTIISDIDTIPESIKFNNDFYKLSSNCVTSKNEIYKYSSMKDILSPFIKESSKNENESYHIYTVSSPSDASGKSLVCETLAEILSKNSSCAILKIFSESPDQDLSLSDLMLMSLKNKNIEESIYTNHNGFYEIPGFTLLRDYVEMEIKNLKNLFNQLNKKLKIDFFIIEVPSYLDKTSEEILKHSKLNLIINDKRKKNQENKLNYLTEISKRALETIQIDNFSKYPKNTNELPILRPIASSENQNESKLFLEKDYFLFKHKLAQCLGDRYA